MEKWKQQYQWNINNDETDDGNGDDNDDSNNHDNDYDNNDDDKLLQIKGTYRDLLLLTFKHC